ncbi:MAG: ATP-dependent nuclease [Syntrophales bacterium]
MKLSRFEIRNFRNLTSISFEWDDFAVLIGENNTGKSSVLQALDWFLSGKQIKDKSFFRNEMCGDECAIEFIAHFTDLTDQEKESVAVRGRMHNDQWILKKRHWQEVGEEGEKWKECYYSYHEQEEFQAWPEGSRSWKDWPGDYTEYIEQVKTEVGNARVTPDNIERLKGKIRLTAPHLVTTQTGWVPNPGGGGNWKSNANSIIPEFIFIPAVQEAIAETQAKEATTYGKIINLLIERRLSQREEFRALNEQIQRFKALFAPNPEHPEWEQAEEIAALEDTISEKLSEVISARAKIETTELNLPSVVLPVTVLKIDDGFLTAVSDQGHGLQRTLIITLLQVLNQYSREAREGGEETSPIRSVIFGIEEPEIYLHPQMIRKIKDVLFELSIDPNYQVICTTHFPVFLDMADHHRSIVRFDKDNQRNVSVFQVCEDILAGPTPEEQRQQLRMITEFDSSVNELFFAKRIVLVEGDTDMAVFQKAVDLLNLLPNPLQKRDTTFINCRGKSCIILFIKVLNHFKIKYVVVYDIDHRNDPENQKIVDEASPESTIITFDPNLERLLGYPPSGNDKPIKAVRKVQELHERNAFPVEFVTKLKQIYGV